MSIDIIIDLISTVAFPICMCILEAWYIKYQTDNFSKQVADFEKSLDANTAILTKLIDKMEEEDKK